jgi:hypothetical protein
MGIFILCQECRTDEPGRRLGSGSAAGGRLRHRSDPPRHHLPGQPGTRLPLPAGGPEPLPLLLALQQEAARALPARPALLGDLGNRRAAHHLPAGDEPRAIAAPGDAVTVSV